MKGLFTCSLRGKNHQSFATRGVINTKSLTSKAALVNELTTDNQIPTDTLLKLDEYLAEWPSFIKSTYAQI